MTGPAAPPLHRRTADLRKLVRSIDAATPAGRDRALDALRGLAVLGVVTGHWLVSALVDGGVDTGHGTLAGDSPLRHMPWLAPVSWIFQTLAVFFLVGGHVAAKGHAAALRRGVAYRRWLRGRIGRLSRPMVPLAAVWTVAAVVLLVTGTDPGTVGALLRLVLSPLWFLVVFAVLTAATPIAARIGPLWPLLAVACADAARFALGGPAWLGWVNVAAAWLVPYALGAAWAEGRFGRRGALCALVGGAAGAVALVVWGGYPASMVGVPGQAVSNLDPPTLAAVAFGLAQCGAAVLLSERLRRLAGRPAVWAGVALVNLSAMTLFLWHQTAMIAVTVAGLPFGPVPGLGTVPATPGWIAARLCWLPVFALVLAVCWIAFGPAERRERDQRKARDV